MVDLTPLFGEDTQDYTERRKSEGDDLALTGDDATAWYNNLFTFWSNEAATLPQTGATEGHLVRVDDLGEFDVENAEDEDLGDVVEMILGPAAAEGASTDTGAAQQIRYVVVGIGGFLGLGEELVAIPFDRLEWQYDDDDAERDVFILNVDRETLEQAPRFDSLDVFPFTGEAGWDTDIGTFWRNIGGG